MFRILRGLACQSTLGVLLLSPSRRPSSIIDPILYCPLFISENLFMLALYVFWVAESHFLGSLSCFAAGALL